MQHLQFFEFKRFFWQYRSGDELRIQAEAYHDLIEKNKLSIVLHFSRIILGV